MKNTPVSEIRYKFKRFIVLCEDCIKNLDLDKEDIS